MEWLLDPKFKTEEAGFADPDPPYDTSALRGHCTSDVGREWMGARGGEGEGEVLVAEDDGVEEDEEEEDGEEKGLMEEDPFSPGKMIGCDRRRGEVVV